MKRPVTTEAAPRGRPKSAAPSSSVSCWLPAVTHDKLIRLAQKEERSISACIRQLLILKLR